jgi:hypothetical protein
MVSKNTSNSIKKSESSSIKKDTPKGYSAMTVVSSPNAKNALSQFLTTNNKTEK